MKRLKAEGNKDLLDLVVAKIKATAPRGENAEAVEVTRTNKGILSRIQYVLKTGIDSIDDMVGGFPFGRVTEVYGLEGCGKTGLAIRSAIQAQTRQIYEKINDGETTVTKRIGGGCDVTVLYVDNEGSLDNDEKIIINGVRLEVVLARCDTVDQMFKMIDNTMSTIDEYGIKHKRQQFIVIIVDTIAGTSSKEELSSEWGKEDYPRHPKQLRQGFRKIIREINKRNVCMICTNQVSDSYKAKAAGRPQMTTPQDDDFSTFGGRALKFYASVRVFMYKVANVYKLMPKAQFAAGYLVGFYTAKNRVLKPCRSGRAVILFDRGFDNVFSILETLVFLKFAEYNEGAKGISFRFKANGIEPKTFGKDDDEDETTGSGNPSIKTKAEWPAFYEKHKEDFDVMWSKAVQYAFATEGIDQVCRSEDDDDSDLPTTKSSVEDEDDLISTT